MTTLLNQYRVMWVQVLFDLPTATEEERKIYTDFRKRLMADGFKMYQYSVYVRHCASRENAETHIARVEKNLPPQGKISIVMFTDKQFGDMRVFYGTKYTANDRPPEQLQLF